MKTIVFKKILKEGLSVVSRISQKNISLPILSSVLISCKKNSICLKATDLEIGVVWSALSRTEEEGEIACPLKILQGAIDGIPLEKISLRTEDKKIFLTAEGFNIQINGLDAEEFPIIPEPETKATITIESGQLADGLAQVVDMAAVSSIQPEISGICFGFSDHQLKLAATDSFRLAEKIINLGKKIEKEVSFILPQKACREIINLFGSRQENLLIRLGASQITIESSDKDASQSQIHFFSRLIDGEYPNYQEIIPQKFDFEASLSKNDFLQRVKSAGVFANKINEIKIRIFQKEQRIEIEGQNLDVGGSVSSLNAEISGKSTDGSAGRSMEISFNWRFLADGLAQMKDQDLIFALNKEEGPAVIKPKKNKEYLYLLMPLRT